MKAYYEVNKEKIKANGKDWKKTNRERVKLATKLTTNLIEVQPVRE